MRDRLGFHGPDLASRGRWFHFLGHLVCSRVAWDNNTLHCGSGCVYFSAITKKKLGFLRVSLFSAVERELRLHGWNGNGLGISCMSRRRRRVAESFSPATESEDCIDVEVWPAGMRGAKALQLVVDVGPYTSRDREVINSQPCNDPPPLQTLPVFIKITRAQFGVLDCSILSVVRQQPL